MFGRSVAISENTAIVGARYHDGESATGSAYLFNTTTGSQIAKLTASDGSNCDNFGYSVAISDGIFVVGSDRNSVYLYSNTPEPGTLFVIACGMVGLLCKRKRK